ncbi:MAG: OB-fold domain-containing protein [Leptospiraceae bacterium]|nr:OB-fold domain-containing protein [Leptospiraceae bacterium]MDW8306797.1 OB-fold domain-containing protein [Leptospiraceae bacterium]
MNIPAIKCGDCGTVHPRGVAVCPACGSEKIQEYEAKGEGEIHTYTVNCFVPAGKFKDRAPYVIAVVRTVENMFLTALVDTESPFNIKIGDKVRFRHYEDPLTPVFELAS